MDSNREEILKTIEEDLMVLSETLGNFSRMSIYNPDKKFFVQRTKEDIDHMLKLREKIKNKPI